MSRSKLKLLAIALVAGMLASIAFSFGTFDLWQEKTRDFFFIKRHQPQNVIIIGVDDASLASVGQWPWPRAVFADAINKLGSAQALGFDILFSEPSSRGADDDLALANAIAQAPMPVVLPIELRSGDFAAVVPLEEFQAHAKLGFINVNKDADGVVRQALLNTPAHASFAEVLSGVATPLASERIPYFGPEKTFITFSMKDLLDDKIPPEILKGSTVLIGATAESLHDDIDTPFGSMPGVEVHAAIAASLQSNNSFADMPMPLSIFLIFAASLLALGIVLAFKKFSALSASFIAALIALVALGPLLFGLKIIIPHFYILLSFLLSGIALVLMSYVSEGAEKRFIRKTFQYYLMPEVIDDLIKSPHKLALGGEKRKVTILFSDIRGFTTISEGMSPEQLTHVINEYLTAMTDAIMDGRGLVDKYIGDAIMAFWGAPLDNAKQGVDAASVVAKMLNTLEELNIEWEKQGIPHIAIGVGLNTGDAVVGNMGSSKRFNYTLMGDEVNFASRLEGLTKAYGVRCIISESTRIELAGAFPTRELDLVRVKGKKEPRKIFELITRTIDGTFKQILEHFALGKQFYDEGKWIEAQKEFKAALALGPDGPSTVFLERSEHFEHEPPENWTGVYDFKTK